MDFDLSDEQRLLKDSVDRMIAGRYTAEARRSGMAQPDGWSRDTWAAFAELGLLGLPFAEEHGGFGGGPVETMLVMEAFGRGLVIEPYLATVVLGGGLLRRGGSEALKGEILAQIAAGELTLAFAQQERGSRYDLHDVQTTARRDGESYQLSGEKSLVLHGASADMLLVTARVAGGRRDRGGIGLFLVDAKAPGLSRRGYPTQDGMQAAEISLDNVRVGPEGVVGEVENALPLIERVADEAMAAVIAEAVGAMDVAHASTVEYLKTRKQFGVAIGSFQSLQHRAADMFVALEQARSMMYFATMMAGEEDAAIRAPAIAAAKVQIGHSGRIVGQGAIQLHGGVGVTMEYAIGHYFRRLTMIDTACCDADRHLVRVAEAGGLFAPAAAA